MRVSPCLATPTFPFPPPLTAPPRSSSLTILPFLFYPPTLFPSSLTFHSERLFFFSFSRRYYLCRRFVHFQLYDRRTFLRLIKGPSLERGLLSPYHYHCTQSHQT